MRFNMKTAVTLLLLFVAVVLFLLRRSHTAVTATRQQVEVKSWAEEYEQAKTKDSLILPASGVVNVIEEHHEALMYWFSAASNGTIKKQGNTLLHIDGHNEAASPVHWRKMPLFQFPKRQEELNQMMEKSNAFVHVAAVTGLINRFIWVWPPYDSGGYQHENSEPYVSLRLKVGVMFQPRDRRDVLVHCACAESDQLKMEKTCVWIDAHRDGSEEYFEIPESTCVDMSLSGTVEFVSTGKAIELAKSGTWITANDSIILDIDEDYYGSEAASSPLYESGMSKTQIKEISSSVGMLLCVGNAHDEMMADKFFHDLLKIILKHIKPCDNNAAEGNSICSDHLAMTNAVIGNIYDILEKARHVMCMPTQSTQYMLNRLLNDLLYLNERQLEELTTVGVCMNQSPRSTFFNLNDGVVLCQGYNAPRTTLIQYQSVDKEAIDQTTNHLQTILSHSFPPGVVTLARSVRDGFTPRKHAHTIEYKVINVLKTVFPNSIDDSSIHYDSQLLGGKDGWYFRHKTIKA
ncbi:uncharacterized protein LOC124135269 [Haliotis rufescens]|uniref:uncharacterized protein LOC124135269 n=1 Tax=Haliotis rufescens TaxID=6454 RepID=UPI00201F0ADF|nr:uncharacterized protein LOC124135269 [Haliotis rufescens]